MSRTDAILKLVVAVNAVFLLLLGFAYPHLEAGSGAHVAAVLAFVPTVLSLALATVVWYVGLDVFVP
ncbi:hypothetical protein [Saliphagus infecundisoli]|uniref:Uncharacterized protein n=1 Tax=Saliphagus infecundisoli TaxID=1849069 RepID=A0ABD5QA98_9EURY|nr:hypothetical protein [Saliphagus infecundisoli]